MTTNKAQHGTPFSQTTTDSTHAVATQAAVATSAQYITSVTVSSDKATSILLIKSGTTTIWQAQVGATFFNMNFDIPLGGVVGALVSAEIDGTSLCKANIAGFTI